MNNQNPLAPIESNVSVVPKTPPQQSGGLAITQSVRLSQVQAEMFSRIQLALLLPRNWMEIGQKLLLRCEDPAFAKKAYYKKPMTGAKAVEGLSIRFAEEAQALMRNVSIDTSPEMEDEFSAHYRITLIDLEGNAPESETFKVDKTVERHHIDESTTVISQRLNSKGEVVYLIPATEEQFNSKLRARKSIVKRGLVLAKIPIDIREACLAKCQDIARRTDVKDPNAATKEIISAFLMIGVEPSDLKEYLGHSPASLAVTELEELRSIYALIRDGELIWPDVIEAKREGAPKGSKREFVEQKKKEREKNKTRKTRQAAARPADPPPQDPAAGAAPPADPAAATPPADPATAEDKPAAPPRQRANRRDT